MRLTSAKNKKNLLFSWLEGLSLLAWGILLLKYTLTGQYKLLIHPNYFSLVLGSGIVLIILGIIKIESIVKNRAQNNREHITLFPPGLGSRLLLLVAIAGLLIPPKVLTSQTALKRGVGDLPFTTIQPQAFRTATKTESRSLIEWIRTINAYPEPDAYSGQAANITGFVLHLPELPNNYIMLSRFVVTCCAVDAYPIGIPVKLETSRSNYPVDSWLTVRGVMSAETIPVKDRADDQAVAQKRSVVLNARSITTIPTPADPYSYR
ncbi:TIGR03943 family protein [Pleurocapsa sp. PCC 7319]|uniref:TIGR03943 family putative permease subunit n=1 Tax=Pleurocapsa sp. PCC 7319 TaxID=118161 RepID=UPI000345CD83|nr:TIGR03943 family protein [Pleurocapsa sp. PCC 7319]